MRISIVYTTNIDIIGGGQISMTRQLSWSGAIGNTGTIGRIAQISSPWLDTVEAINDNVADANIAKMDKLPVTDKLEFEVAQALARDLMRDMCNVDYYGQISNKDDGSFALHRSRYAGVEIYHGKYGQYVVYRGSAHADTGISKYVPTSAACSNVLPCTWRIINPSAITGISVTLREIIVE